MMGNAQRYFDEINSYEDIKNLIEARENIYIDFKQADATTGRMENDDKVNFCKAASGYAHQQGGVLVWGVSTRDKNDKEVGIATELKPISYVGTFYSSLQSFIKAATDPDVDGIQHKVIYDNKGADTGFVVSLFPRSDKVHMCLHGKTKYAFYKRLGDGFHPLPTNEIEALFFRTLSPDLELIAFPRNDITTDLNGEGETFWIGISLDNKGNGLGKNCSVYIWLEGDQSRNWKAIGWLDAEGKRG